VLLDAPRVQPLARVTDTGVQEFSMRPMFSAPPSRWALWRAAEGRAKPHPGQVRSPSISEFGFNSRKFAQFVD
jgi:hypothetical protein